MRSNDIQIKDEWIRPDILTFRIPKKILEGLGISMGISDQNSQMNRTFDGSMTNSNSRSPTQRVR